MSAQTLIELLDKQLQLHTAFNKLADEKTESIKKNDMATFEKIVKKEKDFIKAISQLETQRENIVLERYGKKLPLSEIISAYSEQERTRLEDLKAKLVEEIEKLKQKNELNQQLIEQSLSFIELTLDLYMPSADTYNYGSKEDDELNQERPSIFDSRA